MTGHPLRGALFETFAVSEAYKQHDHAGLQERVWFYRDSHGNEVDILAGSEAELSVWEVKASMTVSTDFFTGIERLADSLNSVKSKAIIYGGDMRLTRQGIDIIPWTQIDQVFIPFRFEQSA